MLNDARPPTETAAPQQEIDPDELAIYASDCRGRRAEARNGVQRNQGAGPIRGRGRAEIMSSAAEQIRKAEAEAVWRAELIRRAKEIRDAEPIDVPEQIRRTTKGIGGKPSSQVSNTYVAPKRGIFAAPISVRKYPPVHRHCPTSISRRDPSII